MHRTRKFLAFTTLALSSIAAHARGDAPHIELLATATIPGDARDLSGLLGTDAHATPDALLGSFGSGIDFDRAAGEVVAVCDRGPRDGDNLFACRVHRFTLALDAEHHTASLTLTSTRTLTSSGGGQFVGTARSTAPIFLAHTGNGRTRIPARLDPESVRLASSQDSMWVCEEYAPALDLFTTSGRHTRRLALPDRYTPPPDASSPVRGRQDNRGFESLALSADGSHAYLMTQSPLLQDGALDAEGNRVGINMRLLKVSTNNAAATPRELLYLLDKPGHGVNEILLDDDSHLLVLERDGKGGADAKCRAVYRIDLSSGTEIASIEHLPTLGLPPGVTPIRKEVFLDLLDPRFGLAGQCMPEKIEGLAWGPVLNDGRRTLLISTDNDLISSSPTVIWVFVISSSPPPGK